MNFLTITAFPYPAKHYTDAIASTRINEAPSDVDPLVWDLHSFSLITFTSHAIKKVKGDQGYDVGHESYC